MSLPDAWVDALFGRLAVRYGTAWTRMWEGIDAAAVRADWAAELAGFGGSPEAIKYALEHLPPDRPPNAAQFRALCINRPEPMPKALPAPRGEIPPAVAEKLAAIGKGQARPHAWAYELQEREKAGQQLTEAQRIAWRKAIAEVPLESVMMEFRPVDPECLPPGMREEAQHDSH